MAQKRVLMVGVRKQGKRWQITVEGTDRAIMTAICVDIQEEANVQGATILGSNPLVGIEQSASRPRKRNAKKSNRDLAAANDAGILKVLET